MAIDMAQARHRAMQQRADRIATVCGDHADMAAATHRWRCVVGKRLGNTG